MYKPTKEEIVRAQESGIGFARKTIPLRYTSAFAYKLSDNPYDIRICKKLHIAWHNAFYKARKQLISKHKGE